MIRLEGDGPLVMVDDDPLDIDLMRRCLAKSKVVHEFKPFTSGYDFLHHMESVKSGTEPMPALVFLDINMPMIDGFTVLEELRSDNEFGTLPIIVFLSNSDSPQDVRRCEELKAEFREKFERMADCVAFLDRLVS